MSVTVGFYGPSIEALAGGAWGFVAGLVVALPLAYAGVPDLAWLISSQAAFWLTAFGVTAWLERLDR